MSPRHDSLVTSTSLPSGTDDNEERIHEPLDLDSSSSRVTASADAYRAVADDLTEVVCRFCSDGMLTFVNEAFCQVFGKSASDLIGSTWQPIAAAEDLAAIEAKLRLLSPDNPVVVVENRVFVASGEVRWMQFVNRAHFDAQGNLTETLSVGRDIHESKEADLYLRETVEHFEATFHASPIGMVLLNFDGRVLSANRAFAAMLGYSPEELTGRHHLMFTHPDDRTPSAERLQGLATGAAGVSRHEKRFVTKDGCVVWARVTATAILDIDGKPTYCFAQVEDVTEQRAAQEELERYRLHLEQQVEARTKALDESRQSSAFARAVLNSVTAHIAVLDRDGTIQAVNDAWLAFGVANEGLPGMTERLGVGANYLAVCDAAANSGCEDAAAAAAGIRSVLEGQTERFLLEYACHAPNRERWFILAAMPFRYHGQGAVVSHTNITERKLAEQALRGSEERIRTIVDSAMESIVTIDLRGTILDVNTSTVRMFGYSVDELIGQNLKMLMPAPFRDEHDEYLARYQRTGQRHVIGIRREVVARRKDGSVFPVELAVGEVAHLGMYTGIMVDITSRRELQRYVLESAAADQRRIAHELHDGTGQELTGISLYLGALGDLIDALPHARRKGKPARIVDEAALQKLTRTVATLNQKLTETKRHVSQLSRGLMPVHVDAEGLRSALEQLAASTNASRGISCRFDYPSPVTIANNTVAMHLYRIAQEAVNNAVQHSRGDDIRIALSQEDAHIVLEVTDNGKGINLAERSQIADGGLGMGMRTMDYRCGIIGGTLQVERRAEGGTVIRCIVPTVQNAAGVAEPPGDRAIRFII